MTSCINNYRLGFFLDFTVQNNLRYLDQVDRKQLLRYVKFLRDHESDLDDRTIHNVFETLNTFLRTRDIFTAGKILVELDLQCHSLVAFSIFLPPPHSPRLGIYEAAFS